MDTQLNDAALLGLLAQVHLQTDVDHPARGSGSLVELRREPRPVDGVDSIDHRDRGPGLVALEPAYHAPAQARDGLGIELRLDQRTALLQRLDVVLAELREPRADGLDDPFDRLALADTDQLDLLGRSSRGRASALDAVTHRAKALLRRRGHSRCRPARQTTCASGRGSRITT